MRELLLLGGLGGLVLGWNMPNHYPLWTSFHGELAAALAIVLLFAGLAWPQPRAGSTPARPMGLPRAAQVWLAVALIPPLQFLAGKLAFRGDAAIGLLYGLGVALSLYAGALWAAQSGSGRALRFLWTTIVFGALVAFAFAMAQWLRLPPASWWAMELIETRPYANFAQPNHFGLMMVLGIVAAVALYEMRAIAHRASLALVGLAFYWGVLISQSRASMLALLLLAACWCSTRRRVPATRLQWVDVAAGLAVGALLYFGIPTIEEWLYLRVAELRAPAEVGPRGAIWSHFLAAISARPWLGYGFGQGVLALSEVAGQVAPSRNTIYAHNVVLDLMTWVGVPAALLLTAAFAMWMLSWLRRGAEPALSVQRQLVFAAWLALVVQSMLEYQFAYAYFLLPAALLAGAVAPLPAAKQPVVASRWVLCLAAAATALLAILAWEYLQLEDDFRANRFERYQFTNRPEHVALTRPLVLDQLAALNASSHFELKRGMPEEQIEQLHVLARRFHLLPTRIEYAKALVLNGRAVEAERELAIIRSIHAPVIFERIDRDWRAWLAENSSEVAPQQ